MDEGVGDAGRVADELRAMGRNLRLLVLAGWDRPERRRLQTDLEAGLAELAAAVGSAVEEFSTSPQGRRLEAEVRALGDRVRTGALEAEIREDLTEALRRANAELERVADRLRREAQGSEEESNP